MLLETKKKQLAKALRGNECSCIFEFFKDTSFPNDLLIVGNPSR